MAEGKIYEKTLDVASMVVGNLVYGRVVEIVGLSPGWSIGSDMKAGLGNRTFRSMLVCSFIVRHLEDRFGFVSSMHKVDAQKREDVTIGRRYFMLHT